MLPYKKYLNNKIFSQSIEKELTMAFEQLILRIKKSLVACFYKVERENVQLKRKLEQSNTQRTTREKALHEVIRSLLQQLDESNVQWRDVSRKCVIQSEQIARLQEVASCDPLTDLLNRRGFEKALHRQISLIQRYTLDNNMTFHSPYMILLDLDTFKEVNDTYGHQKGDEVLLAVAEILREVFHRDTDIVCRIGGDEFLIVLSSSTHDQAIVSAELLRRKIEESDKFHFSSHVVTASIGITECGITQITKPDEMDDIFEKTKKLADEAMYHSKKKGKNVVTVAIGDILCIL